MHICYTCNKKDEKSENQHQRLPKEREIAESVIDLWKTHILVFTYISLFQKNNICKIDLSPEKKNL